MNNLLTYFPIFADSPKAQKRLTMLKKSDTQLAKSPQKADYLLIGGGDGFMLDMLKKYAHFNIPFLGVNCGTLGFLLNGITHPSQLPTSKNDITHVPVSGMEVEVLTSGGEKHKVHCFNDIMVGGNILDYFTYGFKSETFTQKIKGSGFVLTTPVGSTAYWLALGGPLMPLHANLWGLVGIATMPFHYKFLSQKKIVITIDGRKPAMIGIDGYASVFHYVTKITCSPSKKKVTLAFLSSTDFETKRILIAEQKLYSN